MEKNARLQSGQLITVEDLAAFKQELLAEIRSIMGGTAVMSDEKKWLKTSEVKKMLNMSAAKLHVLRANKLLPFTRIGGIIYYDRQDIVKMFERNKTLVT